jgi:hypothetical protein
MCRQLHTKNSYTSERHPSITFLKSALSRVLSRPVFLRNALELKNGSLIKGKFMRGTESDISFQVGSSVQNYNLADIVSLKFDSERPVSDQPEPSTSSLPSELQPAEYSGMKAPA